MKTNLIACFFAATLLPLAAHAQEAAPKPATLKVFAPRLPEVGEAMLLELSVGNLPAGTTLAVDVFTRAGALRQVGSVAPFPSGSTVVATYDIGFIQVNDLNLFEKSAMLSLSVVNRRGDVVGPGDSSIVKNANIRLINVSEDE
jgi:hypothetical protein